MCHGMGDESAGAGSMLHQGNCSAFIPTPAIKAEVIALPVLLAVVLTASNAADDESPIVLPAESLHIIPVPMSWVFASLSGTGDVFLA